LGIQFRFSGGNFFGELIIFGFSLFHVKIPLFLSYIHLRLYLNFLFDYDFFIDWFLNYMLNLNFYNFFNRNLDFFFDDLLNFFLDNSIDINGLFNNFFLNLDILDYTLNWYLNDLFYYPWYFLDSLNDDFFFDNFLHRDFNVSINYFFNLNFNWLFNDLFYKYFFRNFDLSY